MSKTRLFSLGEYDQRFEHFFLDEEEEVWIEYNGETYPLQFGDGDEGFTNYFSFFGKKLVEYGLSPEQRGELFLEKLFGSAQWNAFINEDDEENSNDSYCGFFVIIHAESEQEKDEEDDELTTERFVIDGVFSGIEDAFDYMDEISKQYPDIEFIVLSSLGSVKRSTSWTTHE